MYQYCEVKAGYAYAGGIVGSSGWDKGAKSPLSFDDCHNTGDISGNTQVGGILGYREAYVVDPVNCTNIGTITAHQNDGTNWDIMEPATK